MHVVPVVTEAVQPRIPRLRRRPFGKGLARVRVARAAAAHDAVELRAALRPREVHEQLVGRRRPRVQQARPGRVGHGGRDGAPEARDGLVRSRVRVARARAVVAPAPALRRTTQSVARRRALRPLLRWWFFNLRFRGEGVAARPRPAAVVGPRGAEASHRTEPRAPLPF